ncbi:hypothetical protein HF888_16370 (plasmid) [Bermanella marisrubri]|uniref:TrbC family F-type conjugative pilus assembly protein n=1 Tax=Bermanella marisrubri TaxID=207949 RepID=UPI00031D2867|nr:TrbC family F-type conjugative pilus assembly protein [Bermanella marisrubri]QIZ85915.1 hypothetical protein HF888_16370 [Bermanella marisrubri]
MLRFLVIFLLFSLTFIATAYEEPTDSEIAKSKEMTQNALKHERNTEIYREEIQRANQFFSKYENHANKETLGQAIESNGFITNHYNELMDDHFNSDTQAEAKDARAIETNILIFVSFSMDVSDIFSLAKDAHDIGGHVVLNGFKKDLETTLKIISEMNTRADKPLPFLIDPTLFDRFSVQSVPHYVLPLESVMPCLEKNVCHKPRSIEASGLVPIKYFLELAERNENSDVVEGLDEWIKLL